MSVHTVSHPITRSILSKLRLKSTSAKEFRELVHTITFVIGIEVTRFLEEEAFSGESPVSEFEGTSIKNRVGLAPVLRAGIGMTDSFLSILPAAHVYHLGIFKDKSNKPIQYYAKMPNNPPVDVIFVLDPVISTGGTSCASIGILNDAGVAFASIKIVSILASQEGISRIQSEYPDVEIWTAAIDENMITKDGHRLIAPGVGDPGDRFFNAVV